MSKILETYRDEWGWVGRRVAKHFVECGDAPQRIGMLQVASYLSGQDYLMMPIKNYAKQIYLPHKKQFTRHPDITRWYGQVDVMSRDNWLSFVIGLGEDQSDESKYWVTKSRNLLRARGYFLWNNKKIGGEYKPWYEPPDFGGPLLWLAYERAQRTKDQCLLDYLDRALLYEARRIVKNPVDDTSDDLNMILLLLQSRHSPTKNSREACRSISIVISWAH